MYLRRQDDGQVSRADIGASSPALARVAHGGGDLPRLRVPKTCATWAKALQSAVERSACAGAVLARREVG